MRHKMKIVSAVCLILVWSSFLWGCGREVQETGSEAVKTEPADLEAEKGVLTDTGRKEEETPDPESREEIAALDTGDCKKTERNSTETEDTAEENEQTEKPVPPKIKGIFVTGQMAGSSNMEKLIEMVDRTELNAMVLDLKNDEGRVVYDMQIPAVQEIGAGINYIQDMKSLVAECKEKNIYLIARMVAFKDPFLAEAKPEWCIHNQDGTLFRDKGGLAWLNPYCQEVWEYLLEIAEEALRAGFDEVQFDYIRFSTDKGMKNVDFGQKAEGRDREQIITDFVKYASDRIHKAGGMISADVYGMVIDSEIDQQIVGQNYREMSRYLDYISPMVYPSHYGPYNYNIPVPDAEPYRLVLTAMQSSKKILAGIPVKTVSENTVSGNEGPEYTDEQIAGLMPMEGIRAQVRPWLQDFTASWVKGHIPYGAKEIRDQIQAVYDAGYEEWILWNAANRYTEDGLLKEE